MADTVQTPLLDAESGHAHGISWSLRPTFTTTLAGFLTVILAAFCVFVDYDDSIVPDAHVSQYYMWYIHVAIMIFVGFGFLMTFLRRYSYSAVALNFLTSCVVMLESILVIGFVQQFLWGSASGHIVKIDLPLIIDSAFCAGACMITFGALIGKVTPTQILWILILEVPLYAVNQQIVTSTLGALDVGGSITIHAFGAYFGLAATLVLSPPTSGAAHPKNNASYVSDVTAMIGTIFLWIFWPSFNGSLAESGPEQFSCVANTVVALLGATIAAFAASAAVDGKLNMVHIQNATLAGGVAMGSAANLPISPAAAVTVGIAAGVLSVCGYKYVMPFLESKIKLCDTCGVHNLHGMPGVLGGIASAVLSFITYSSASSLMAKGAFQPSYQLIGLMVNLVIAIAGGFAVGLAASKVKLVKQDLKVEDMFEDAVFWEEVEPEEK